MIRSLLPIRGLTARFAKVSLSTPAALPANLTVANEKVFKPLPEPVMNEMHYYFPTMDVPASIPVHKFTEPGQFVEEMPLTKKIFEVAIRRDIINDVVKFIRAQKRQPHKTKRISEISGSNIKPRPQKGQGYAQVGHKRNSAWRGGAKAHGPRLRDYTISINRKVRALGTMMTFTAKLREGNLMVVDNFNISTHKTKDLSTILKSHGLEHHKSLFIAEEFSDNFKRASSNLELSKALTRAEMDIYEILKKHKLIITQDAFQTIQENLMEQYTYNAKRNFYRRSKEIILHCEKEAEVNGFAEAFKNESQ